MKIQNCIAFRRDLNREIFVILSQTETGIMKCRSGDSNIILIPIIYHGIGYITPDTPVLNDF